MACAIMRRRRRRPPHRETSLTVTLSSLHCRRDPHGKVKTERSAGDEASRVPSRKAPPDSPSLEHRKIREVSIVVGTYQIFLS